MFFKVWLIAIMSLESMVTLLNKSKQEVKIIQTCAKPPCWAPFLWFWAPQRTCISGLGAPAELQQSFPGESRLFGSQDLQSPPLVQFPLIKCVEDHLVLVVLMAS